MEAKTSSHKKWTVIKSLVMLAIAIPPFLNSLDNPHLKGLRIPDYLRLPSSCFLPGSLARAIRRKYRRDFPNPLGFALIQTKPFKSRISVSVSAIAA